MSNLSRRNFLVGTAAISLSAWLEQEAIAAPTVTRHNVMTAEGQAMLLKYADAVKAMMKMPQGSPIGWLFQWYTHSVRGDRTKAGEITRIYPTGGAHKSLAQEMWSTCQAHNPSDDENNFLPWHRMYVYYLERIVRKISMDPGFTLPYWNYSQTNIASGPSLPSGFIMPADAANPLYRKSRNALVNNGQPIDTNDPGSLNLDALKETSYAPHGVAQGFCQALDSGLHGNVHVEVGNQKGMGQIPWAAYDPIFWMHHCNIDRLWASWNRGGGKNPTDAAWLKKQFVFADENGRKVTGTIKDFLEIGPLGYTYDRFEEAHVRVLVRLERPLIHARVAGGMVALNAEAVHASLDGQAGVPFVPITDRVKQLAPQHRLFLVLKGLHATAQPGVLYHVFLDLPAGASPREQLEHHVGILNFFSATGHGDHMAENAGAGADRFFSFDVTDVAKNLQSKGLLTAKPTVTIVPFGQPAADAAPMIGEITLAEQ